nr:MAG TPA: hypothetical protein [Caudoviricetes sp.]
MQRGPCRLGHAHREAPGTTHSRCRFESTEALVRTFRTLNNDNGDSREVNLQLPFKSTQSNHYFFQPQHLLGPCRSWNSGKYVLIETFS